MRYNQIKEYDVANGVGVRVSLWTQGCSMRCDNCFNKKTWDFNDGKEFTEDTISHIIKLLKDDSYIKRNFSVLGGEPLEKVNIDMLTRLLKEIKYELQDVDIWIWTSHLFENAKHLELMSYIDVLVDGKFVQELYSPTLKFKGSSNQRIIDVQESLKQDKVILYLE